MLSFISKIKNIVSKKIKSSRNVNRKRQYEVVVDSDIMTVYPECGSGGGGGSGGDEDVEQQNDAPPSLLPIPPPPPPSPVILRTLFRTEIDNKVIQRDYELQQLLRMMDIHNIHVEQLVL